jgi:hypothetical protein
MLEVEEKKRAKGKKGRKEEVKEWEIERERKRDKGKKEARGKGYILSCPLRKMSIVSLLSGNKETSKEDEEEEEGACTNKRMWVLAECEAVPV